MFVQKKEWFPKPDVTSLFSGGELFERFLDGEFAPKEPEINGFVKQVRTQSLQSKNIEALHLMDFVGQI